MTHNEAPGPPDQFPRDMDEAYADLVTSIVAGAGEVTTSERGLLQRDQPDKGHDSAISNGDNS